MRPVISIVGRPNVGKSTLFNRILGYRKAITEDTPGVTRDRNYGEFEYHNNVYLLIDTGGFETFSEEIITSKIREQIEISLKESHAVIFMLDVKDGLIPEDIEIYENLRKLNKPLFCVINKVDSGKRELLMGEFYELGAEKLYPISAMHGIGVDELLEDIVSEINKNIGLQEKNKKEDNEKDRIKIAFVGRPNTGKSSIVNRILGSERMIVSEIPGTTRDAIDTEIEFMDKKIILIDTAGLRKKSKIIQKTESYSVASAIKSIERADVVNLVIDAKEGISHQDGSIAHTIITRGRGLCIVLNKWDLLEKNISKEKYREMVAEKIPHVSYSPIVIASAKTGMNMENIIETDMEIYEELKKRIPTSELNKFFNEITKEVSLSYIKGRHVKIFYIHQQKVMPPTFILFSNYPELIPEHYKRYLENALRREYGYIGAPIKFIFRKKR